MLAVTGLALWATCAVLRIPVRGVFCPDPAPGQDAGKDRRVQRRRVFSLAFLAIVVTMIVMGMVTTLVPDEAVGGFTTDTRADAAWTALMLGPAQLTTALIEEPVALGLLVLLLGAAHRPVWEIYAIGALVKIGYHLYYGPRR